LSRVLRHNLSNDVTVIAGRAENIRDEVDKQRVRTDAETIRRKAGEVARLTESVKQIDRAMAETVADRTLENATDAVTEVVEPLRERYPDASVTVTERDEMWVHIDDAFDHALTHAVDNAIRHDDGDPSVEVTVGASPNTGRVEIRIADTAPPIPDTELDAIDDPTQTTTTAHGSGTGLFVMKWCVESLGGELRFDRHDGGNVVTIYLPPKRP
jgi:signal transduction histidine kinase